MLTHQWPGPHPNIKCAIFSHPMQPENNLRNGLLSKSSFVVHVKKEIVLSKLSSLFRVHIFHKVRYVIFSS
jgi:hypothetical protein